MSKKTNKKRSVVRRTIKRRGGVGRTHALPRSNNREAWGNSNMSRENREERQAYYTQQALNQGIYGYNGYNENYENNENNENNGYNENNAFEVPESTNNLNSIELPSNAVNSISYESINFNRPILNINNESRYKRYYQNRNTVKYLKNTKTNPFTKVAISNIKWKMPKPTQKDLKP